MSGKTKIWTSTRVKHLYKHQSGVYYARIRVNRKLTWRSLKTKLKSVAEPKLKELLDTESRKSELNIDGTAPETLGQLLALRKAQILSDVSTKKKTKVYWEEIFAALEKSWPKFSETKISQVSQEQCEKWAADYALTISASRFNNTVGALKKLFELSIEKGVRQTNPAKSLKRLKLPRKDLSEKLPNNAKFKEWVTEIRNGRGRFSKAAADFVEFLAYSGLRTGEAKYVLWKDCDFERGEIVIKGDPDTGTKNWETRRIPMIEPMRSLLLRIRKLVTAEPESPVCLVNEAQKAMDRAATKVGMVRVTHHELRHLFATTCIESGVPIPTVAAWLGHKDGGALAMKTYGHLRNEHSLAEAKKVSFG